MRQPSFTASLAVPFGWNRAAGAGLSFRPISETDLPFLARLYASTRSGEIALWPWTDQQKASFLDQQFRARQAHYHRYYDKAEWLLMIHAGADIGRLTIERRPDEHCIIDIALLPAHRGQGLGAALLRYLIDEAAAAGKTVSLHVEKSNPAMRLYGRLGFKSEEDNGVHERMRWSPPG
jgi:ribosomal protein S18 acetylase RimI-like enzyme